VQAADGLGGGQLGQRARDAQHAVIAAHGELQPPGRFGQQLPAGRVRGRDLF
jgi:hypothetical protein